MLSQFVWFTSTKVRILAAEELGCRLHVSDSTIEYLLRDQPEKIDLDLVCWRAAKSTIIDILKKKWALLLKAFEVLHLLALLVQKYKC